MSVHKGVKHSCNQCDSKFSKRNIKCLYMRESKTNVVNVIQNSVSRLASRDLKRQYMSESNTYAINVTVKLVVKVTSKKHKLCLYRLF